MSDNILQQAIHASLIKRLAAILYDLFLVISLFFIVGIIIASLTTFIINNGQAITKDHPFYLIYQIYLLSILLMCGFLFFGWFWTHGGQTLGMKTWKLKLVSDDGKNITWKQAAIRFFSAIVSWGLGGMGFISALWDKDNKTWHDHLSKTQLVQLTD